MKKTNKHFIPRLYVEHSMAAGGAFKLNSAQSHYVLKVMRLRAGEQLLFFNGQDGEWAGVIDKTSSPGEISIIVAEQTRAQTHPCDLHLLFSPLRSHRTAWVGQKAAELGVLKIAPVLMARSIAREVNGARLLTNIIEGAEQSESLFVPHLAPLQPLAAVLENLEPERCLIFCDDELKEGTPAAQLSALKGEKKFAILVGPEGGFAPDERQAILAHPKVQPLRLGTQILRAETATLAAVALFQALVGDWQV